MFKCSCRRMKCDEGSDAWSNLRISHIHVFLQNLRQHVPRKKNMEFAKVRRKKIFFGEDDVFQMKEFRTTLNIFISQDNECVQTDRQLLKGPFPQISFTNQILWVLCLDVMLRRSLPLGSALASALLSGMLFPFRVGIPDSIESSKVPKEEDFENFICWAWNSLAGPGTAVICDDVRPHAWTFVSPCAIQLACASHFKLKSRSFNALH